MPRIAPVVVTLALAACGPRPQPIVYLPQEPAPPAGSDEVAPIPPPAPVTPVPPVVTMPPNQFAVPTLPMGLALDRDTLVWGDLAGALWTMPRDGSTAPKQVSEQHRDGFATHPFLAGDQLIAKAGRDLIALAVPDGPVTHVHVGGLPDLVEGAVGDATTVFVTVFKHDQVLKVPITGGAAKHVLDVKGAVLALHHGTLYAASYVTGELFAIPVAGGAPKTITAKLDHPTALVVDDTAAYAYTETDERVSRIDLATGATTVLGEHLENSDELALAGDSLFTVSWPDKLVQLSTSPGHATRTLESNIFHPRGVVLDDHWVYVTCDSPPRIVRVPRDR